MASKTKKHRAMSDDEWVSRLRRFAATGVWPADAGNRPAPRTKKWHDLYLKIEKCPMQLKGQTLLFRGPQTCVCGFHSKKPSSSVTITAPSAGPNTTGADQGPSCATASSSTSAPAPAPASASSSSPSTSAPSVAQEKKYFRPGLHLSMFTKSRYGSTSAAALKPNINVARKPAQPPTSTITTSATTTASTTSTTITSGISSSSAHSPRKFIRTISPFSLPPSPVLAPPPLSSIPPASPVSGPSAPPVSGPSAPPVSGPSTPPVSGPSTPPVSGPSAPPVSGPSTNQEAQVSGPSTSAVCGPSSTGPDLAAAEDVTHALASDIPWLPVKMRKTIPLQDQRWISAALWRNQRLRTDLKLWYDPPGPALIYHQAPTPERFFTHRLLVWMPYHLWRVSLTCPACKKHLTGYGAHKRARHVLDVDRYYLMITETLRCNSVGCKATYLSSSKAILDQLDLAHRLEFRLILTQRYACDVRVIRFLRERSLGNSPTRLVKQLRENHSEEWLKRLCQYLGACSDFVARPSLFPVVFQDPPEPVAIPTNKWMLTVYGRDILSRLDHIKASVTSTFGSILKLDSTKKITKKLSGVAKGTALWLSSVSNETGQILISVLTAQEGSGLDEMVAGLIQRYSTAGVAPPKLLYVDCDCCMEAGGETRLKARFGGWPDIIIKLDIYHFMRRLAAGCSKDAHPLYPIFMARLSCCIFEWDAGDVALLRRVKREQLKREGVPGITDVLVNQHITKAELALYCRRRTRGERETISLIDQLLHELMGQKGCDFLGVPLLDRERMEHIWQTQRRHVKCIQDEPGVPLYTVTGSSTKEGIVLNTYRCARGSSSLESFHCHLARFIPGTSANSLNFQLYLLEGLNRWNQDRGAASLAVQPPSLLSYSGDLVHCVNTYSVKVLGRKLVPSFQPPAVYTGELIGIDYLFNQTGRVMQNVDPDSEETDQLLEDVADEEEPEDEGFEEAEFDPTVISLGEQNALIQPSSQPHSSWSSLQSSSTPSACSISASALTAPSAGTSILSASPTSSSTLSAPPSSSSTLATPPSSTFILSAPSSSSSSCAAPPSSSSSSTLTAPPSSSSTLAAPSSSSSTLNTPPSSTSTLSAPSSSTSTLLAPSSSTSTLSAPSSSTSTLSAPSSSTSTLSAPFSSTSTLSAPSSSTSTLSAPSSSTSTLSAPSSSTSTLSASPRTSTTLSATPAIPEEQLAVDDRNMPGMDRVDSLAEYLVGLRSDTALTLSNQQSSTIIALWQNLLPFDQQRVVYAARHQERLKTGHFRAPKKREDFTPGVDSMTRCVLGSSGSPAQWPDSCRLVEAIFVRLCQLHQRPVKKGKGTLTRWTLILQDYRKIRQLVLGNGAVMQATTLQLFEVSQTTLIQWHNKRIKRQDLAVLLQGVNLPPPLPVAPAPLPPALPLPTVAFQVPGQQHQYHLPTSTVGQAKRKRKGATPVAVSLPAAASVQPPQRPLVLQPSRASTSAAAAAVLPNPTLASNLTGFAVPPVSSARPIAPAGPLPPPAPVRRSYNRTVGSNKCAKCHQPRTKENGHSQFQGRVYCPSFAGKPLEEWLEEMRTKRAKK